ncbi:MAG: phytanoyl-CoA dioxygenase family protein [bacterium]|nr:phytanoyl-CoA dioxygenase family protein [bacterium]
MSEYRVLTEEQVEQFLTEGFVKIEGCFKKEDIQTWLDFAFERLGYDAADASTWAEERIHMPHMNQVDVATFAPRAWGAICDLMGGEDRIKTPVTWRDGFIVNFKLGVGEPWEPPSPRVKGWHKDGDWFRHFLDSPEQGLLTVILWDDVLPQSGGTFVATDSVGPVARYLVDFPEGLTPQEGAFGKLIDQCSHFVEATGKAGDVYLLHPFILHSASRNPSGRARFITNPAVSFEEPMNFNRKDPAAYSLVERAVLRALGVEDLNFQITRERERITPERVARQQRMLEEQKSRLGMAQG